MRRKVQQALLVRLDRRGAGQREQRVRVAGVAGVDNAVHAVEKDERARCVARHADGLDLHAAELEHVAVAHGQRAHGAPRHDVLRFRHERARRAAARHKVVAARGVAVFVEHLDIRRVHAADAVLERRARVVDVAVREHELHRQVGQLAHKGLKAADARKAVDQKRLFAALDEVAQLAAEAADLRDVVEDPVCCEEFGHTNHHSLFFCAGRRSRLPLCSSRQRRKSYVKNVFFTLITFPYFLCRSAEPIPLCPSRQRHKSCVKKHFSHERLPKCNSAVRDGLSLFPL